MKNRFVTTSGIYLPLAVVLLITSCKKDATSSQSNDPKEDKSPSAASLSDSSAIADNAYFDPTTTAFYGFIDNMLLASRSKHSGATGTLSTANNGQQRLSCAEASIVWNEGSQTVVLNYGSGCATSADSIPRSGKITYLYTGNFISSGSTVTATFDNYFVNGYKIEGGYTLTNASTDVDGDSVTIFKSKVDNGKITFPDGRIYQYSGNKTYTTRSGVNDYFNFLYDSLRVTGDNRFVNAAGDSVTTNITTPLLKTLNCPFISSGVISFVYNGNIQGTLDYGNGDCDSAATVTIGSYSKTVGLH